MYKILIADDNPLILMGMKNMIQWELFHATLAGEAKNGAQALKLIRELKPDLVITDIRMPGKDGLYLLDQIRQNHPEISSIVISAYDEFQYVKEALKAGSIDYILKPIDPEELNKAIKKAFNRNKSEVRKLADLALDTRNNTLLALKTRKYYDISHLSEYLSEFKGIEIRKSEDIFLILCPEHKVKSIEKFLIMHLDDVFLMGKQKVTEGESMENLLRKAVHDASGQILKKSHAQYHSYHGDCLNEEKISLFCTTGNSYSVKEMFHGLIVKILAKSDCDIAEFTKQINGFLQILLIIDKKTLVDVRKLMDKLEGQERNLSYFTVDEVVNDIDGMIERICREYSRILGNKKDLVTKVKEMVLKNYQNDISLNMIAQLFFITPSYLSRLFKQETGTNLNNYITMLRMDKAKQLLEETDARVNDVARMVGYPEPNYFTRVFKKYTGYSPSDKRL